METVRHDYLIVTHYLQQNLGRVVGDNGIIPMMDDQLGDVEVGLRAIERPGGFNILSQAQKNPAFTRRLCSVQLIGQRKCHVVGKEYPFLWDADVCQEAICHRLPSEDVSAAHYRPKKVSIADNAVREKDDPVPRPASLKKCR